jgi:multiple sugar transport system substrate-binding protein
MSSRRERVYVWTAGLVVTMAMAAAVSIGCGSGRNGRGTQERLAFLVPAAERPYWLPVTRAFAAARPNVTVELVEGPTSADLRENLYTAALLARDDSFDLVYMDVTWTPKFAAAGFLLPLDDQFPASELEALLPAAVQAGRYRGRLYRVPIRTDVGLLYYRQDLLAAAGIDPPETFDDVVGTARKLAAPPKLWGLVWQGSQYEGLVCIYLEVLHGHGGFWVDSETLEVGLDRPEALAALEFLVASRRRGGISPPGVTTYKEDEGRRVFQDGRAVFLLSWPYVWRLAQAKGSPVAGKVGVRSVVHLPGKTGAGTLGGWGLGISRFSRRPELALAFVRHAVSLDSQRLLCRDTGYAPTRREAYDDPELRAANPFLAELLPFHAGAVARPTIPRYAQASDILQRHLSAALAGITEAGPALRAAARETRRLLGGEARP